MTIYPFLVLSEMFPDVTWSSERVILWMTKVIELRIQGVLKPYGEEDAPLGEAIEARNAMRAWGRIPGTVPGGDPFKRRLRCPYELLKPEAWEACLEELKAADAADRLQRTGL